MFETAGVRRCLSADNCPQQQINREQTTDKRDHKKEMERKESTKKGPIIFLGKFRFDNMVDNYNTLLGTIIQLYCTWYVS